MISGSGSSTPATTLPPGPAGPPRPRNNTRQLLLIVVVAIIAFGLLRGLFAHHETNQERIATYVTAALQNNDIAGVDKYQNAETATHVTRARVGRGADDFTPLGKLKYVRQTSVDSDTRVYQFDATFDKGVVHETIKFDPDDKIVTFHYDQPVLK